MKGFSLLVGGFRVGGLDVEYLDVLYYRLV